MRILYDSKNSIFKKPYGCLKEGEECTVAIHIPVSCLTNRVFLRFEGQNEYSTELFKTETREDYDIFTGTFSLNDRGLYFYYFYIETENSNFRLFKYGFNDTNIEDGEKWQISCIPKNFTVNDEFKGRVMYQIFPDRFYKSGECDLTGKLTPYTIHSDTRDLPDYLPDEKGEILNNDFFGGNLKGITQKIPYLKDLGVGIIYLNPIFKAFSNHRYDTCDYKTIDPMLGTEEDFRILCEEAHKADIKILLDGVFSHTGSDSIYFDEKDRFGTGAAHCNCSPYRSWYTLYKNGEYDSWWGIKTLPCVNELADDFIDYIITGEDSVIKHWLSLGADGFRLDVADELPDEFIRILHQKVQEVKPGALVLGEVWEDASNKIAYNVRRRYFADAELDSVMNYPFRNAIIDLVTGKITTGEFTEIILTVTENYPKEVTDCLMNSLSTHDTARIMTVLSGAPDKLDRYEAAKYVLSAEEINRAKELILPAVVLQFFMPGTACIYYGDETGAFGFGDPFNRGYFNWYNTENEISRFYKKIAKIKNEYLALKKGSISFFKSENGILGIERTDDENKISVLLNFSDEPYRINKPDTILSCNVNETPTDICINKNGFVIY